MAGFVADLAAMRDEEIRTRGRLHDLEGITSTLVSVHRQRLKEEKRRERKYTRRLNVLTVLTGFAAVISPIVVALIHH